MKRLPAPPLGLILLALAALFSVSPTLNGQEAIPPDAAETARSRAKLPTQDTSFATRLAHAALDRTRHTVRYFPAYVNIPYPGGDVPAETGVCTDEIVRSFRALGVDLQKEVHEDMKRHFGKYPKSWGLTRPDPNIDHRRVLNLQVFLKRQGAARPVSDTESEYLPGDLVTCTVPPHLPHIMIVVPAPGVGSRPWVVHNIGAGPRLEDRLLEFPITGHYRWDPTQ